MDARYITSALKPEQLPEYDQPEIALIGRSNTGKSTLLNTLLGRKNLARHGRTPGQTQLVNFFGLGVGDQLIFADLPGYGFSSAAKHVAGHWQNLMETYIQRPNIKEFFFLIDCRRVPGEDDLELMYFLSKNLPLTVIQTKSDKLNKTALQRSSEGLMTKLKKSNIKFKLILPTSCLKKKGLEPLQKLIRSYMNSHT